MNRIKKPYCVSLTIAKVELYKELFPGVPISSALDQALSEKIARFKPEMLNEEVDRIEALKHKLQAFKADQ